MNFAASDRVCSSVKEVGWNTEIGNFRVRDSRSTVREFVINLGLGLSLWLSLNLGKMKIGLQQKKFLVILEVIWISIYFPQTKLYFSTCMSKFYFNVSFSYYLKPPNTSTCWFNTMCTWTWRGVFKPPSNRCSYHLVHKAFPWILSSWMSVIFREFVFRFPSLNMYFHRHMIWFFCINLVEIYFYKILLLYLITFQKVYLLYSVV